MGPATPPERCEELRTLRQAGADGQQQGPFVAASPVVQLLRLSVAPPQQQQHSDEVLLPSLWVQLGEELHSLGQLPLGQLLGSGLQTQQPSVDQTGGVTTQASAVPNPRALGRDRSAAHFGLGRIKEYIRKRTYLI